jgi:hypothetical protein
LFLGVTQIADLWYYLFDHGIAGERLFLTVLTGRGEFCAYPENGVCDGPKRADGDNECFFPVRDLCEKRREGPELLSMPEVFGRVSRQFRDGHFA